MTLVVAERWTIPCPTCRVPQALTSAHLAHPEGEGAGAACSLAVLSECTRCWARRARALNDAREQLRQSGELGSCRGDWTWRGERLDEEREHDGLEGALASALLRAGVPVSPAVLLALPAAVPAGETAGARSRA